MKNAVAISLCLCAAGAVAVMAAESRYKPLDATYAITGETIIDPDPEEKKDRVSIYINGDAAREIYKAMPVPEEPIPCSDNSPNRQKSAGGLTCFHHEKDDYGCGVAIKLDDGTTKNALAC